MQGPFQIARSPLVCSRPPQQTGCFFIWERWLITSPLRVHYYYSSNRAVISFSKGNMWPPHNKKLLPSMAWGLYYDDGEKRPQSALSQVIVFLLWQEIVSSLPLSSTCFELLKPEEMHSHWLTQHKVQERTSSISERRERIYSEILDKSPSLLQSMNQTKKIYSRVPNRRHGSIKINTAQKEH